ncbi:MAG: MATE family efflux transporter [Fusobacteriaceae bacterium]
MIKFFKNFKKEKDFYKTLFWITAPIVLQSFIASSINMLDTLMIGKVGEIELASVGIANQFYFLYSLTIFGISAGVGVFSAQLWGKKDDKNIKKTLGLGLMIGGVVALVFTLVALFIPEQIISIFNKETKVIENGSSYLIIAALSYIFTMVSFNYASVLRSVGNSSLPMWSSIGALVINGTLNYALIFGNFGFQPMGVKGAAVATLIARAIEALLIVIIATLKEKTLRGKISDFLGAEKSLKEGMYKTAMPIVLTDICWGLGNVAYAVVYGRIGTGATAAVQISSTVLNFFFIAVYGLAVSAVVMVGNEIGAGREKEGMEVAGKISAITLVIGGFLAIILSGSAPYILELFTVSSEVKKSAINILYIYSLLMIPRVYTVILIVGILRAGGDNKYGSIVQGITLWGIGIPLAFIGAFYFKLPVYYVISLTAIEELIKCFVLTRRYRSGKWINNMVESLSSENLEDATISVS